MRGLLYSVLSIFFLTGVISCGGGGGGAPASNEPQPVVVTGVFLDSPVRGLTYTTATRSGVTNALGEFEYINNEVVTFALGGIVLGQAIGASVITPVDLVAEASDQNHPYVINILRLLQTLDEDNDSSNGVTFSSAVLAAVVDSTINPRVSVASFETDVNVMALIQSTTSQSELINSALAQQNFQFDLAAFEGRVVYKVGGSISGLSGSVSLSSDSGETLMLSTNGDFSFINLIDAAATYNISIATQPAGQTCNVQNAQGTANFDVNNISINCSNNTYTVSATVNGLTENTTLVLLNNADDATAITADGSFTFSNLVNELDGYNVTVQSQPASQVCTVANGSAMPVTQNVTDVQISCVEKTYTISVTVNGLASGSVAQDLVLLNNSNETLTVTQNGNLSFTLRVTATQGYSVTVQSQRSGQTCSVVNGASASISQDVTLQVNCSDNTYTVAGNVSGLSSGNSVALLNKSTDATTITDDGSFVFAGAVSELGGYAVTIQTQPAGQTCTVTNGSAASITQNVTNVAVSCVINTYTVGGNISGLAAGESAVLLNNGGDALTVGVNSGFTFRAVLNEGDNYNVTVQNSPAGKLCAVTNGAGNSIAFDITQVSVACAPLYTISGAVKGLNGTLVIQNNGGDNLTVTADTNVAFTTPFVFSQRIVQGSNYNVAIFSLADNQSCTINNGSAANISSDVSNITIECSTRVLVTNLNMPDTALNTCVGSALTGLTYTDELAALSCPAKGIVNLAGIEVMTGLTQLDLSDNQILFIDYLKPLKKIGYLNLKGNPIPLIQAVVDLMYAGTAWDLGDCVRQHIVPGKIERIDQLTELSCTNNPNITSLDQIGKLRFLKKLDLSGNVNLFFSSSPDSDPPYYDRDYAELQKLTSNSIFSPSPLEVLNLRATRLDTLHWVKDFPNLKNLNVSDNHVTDLSPLATTAVKVVDGGFKRNPLNVLTDTRLRYTVEVSTAGDITLSMATVNLPVSTDVYADVFDEAGLQVGSLASWAVGAGVDMNLAAGIYTVIVSTDFYSTPFTYSLAVSGNPANGTAGDANFISPLKFFGASPCNGCLLYSDISPLSDLHNLRHLDFRNNTAITDVSSLSQLHRLTHVGIAGTNIIASDLPANVTAGLFSTIKSGAGVVLKPRSSAYSSVLLTSSDVSGLTTEDILLTLNISHPEPENIVINLLYPYFGASTSANIYHGFSSNNGDEGINLLNQQTGSVVDGSTGVVQLEVINNSDFEGKLAGWSFSMDNGISKVQENLGFMFSSGSPKSYSYSVTDDMITGYTLNNFVTSIAVDYPVDGDLLYDFYISDFEYILNISYSPYPPNDNAPYDGVLNNFSIQVEY